jgi:hypothetical protein
MQNLSPTLSLRDNDHETLMDKILLITAALML